MYNKNKCFQNCVSNLWPGIKIFLIPNVRSFKEKLYKSLGSTSSHNMRFVVFMAPFVMAHAVNALALTILFN